MVATLAHDPIEGVSWSYLGKKNLVKYFQCLTDYLVEEERGVLILEIVIRTLEISLGGIKGLSYCVNRRISQILRDHNRYLILPINYFTQSNHLGDAIELLEKVNQYPIDLARLMKIIDSSPGLEAIILKSNLICVDFQVNPRVLKIKNQWLPTYRREKDLEISFQLTISMILKNLIKKRRRKVMVFISSKGPKGVEGSYTDTDDVTFFSLHGWIHTHNYILQLDKEIIEMDLDWSNCRRCRSNFFEKTGSYAHAFPSMSSTSFRRGMGDPMYFDEWFSLSRTPQLSSKERNYQEYLRKTKLKLEKLTMAKIGKYSGFCPVWKEQPGRYCFELIDPLGGMVYQRFNILSKRSFKIILNTSLSPIPTLKFIPTIKCVSQEEKWLRSLAKRYFPSNSNTIGLKEIIKGVEIEQRLTSLQHQKMITYPKNKWQNQQRKGKFKKNYR